MGIYDVIKYEGGTSALIWKHPCEDFNADSILIVHESQEAIFLRDGKIVHSFTAGRHQLNTQNLPILRHLINIPTGGVSSFHCEIYYVNKIQQMAINWGTPNKIQYLDPVCRFPISIGANGSMSLRVENGAKLLLTLLGSGHELQRDELVSYFRAVLMTKLKTYIVRGIKKNNINIFEIDEQLVDFSEEIMKILQPVFLEYGIQLTQFFITTIVKPEDDAQYQRFKELYYKQYADIAEAELRQKVEIIDQQTQTEKMLIASEGLAKKRLTEGYTYQQEKSFEFVQAAAENEGSAGEITGLGLGLGMVSGIGTFFGSTFNNVLNNTMSETTNLCVCQRCGAVIASSNNYCPNCGTKVCEHEES